MSASQEAGGALSTTICSGGSDPGGGDPGGGAVGGRTCADLVDVRVYLVCGAWLLEGNVVVWEVMGAARPWSDG